MTKNETIIWAFILSGTKFLCSILLFNGIQVGGVFSVVDHGGEI